MQFAECEHRCPFGTIRVRWERSEEKFRLWVTVPVSTTCQVVMPSGELKTVGGGEYEFEELA